MRKVLATGIAWVAIFLLAMSSLLTRLAESIYRPRPKPQRLTGGYQPERRSDDRSGQPPGAD